MARRSLLDRPATAVLERIGNKLWGFKPNLMRHFVTRHGPIGAVAWFASNMPTYERILKRWGPIRTHLLATAISAVNGCPYCTHGHAIAFQLHYYQQTEKLFPIDENEMVALGDQDSSTVFDRFETSLGQAELDDEIPTLRRAQALLADRTMAAGETDGALVHLIDMFAALNACGIDSAAEIDQVHDPINRDLVVRERYEAARRDG